MSHVSVKILLSFDFFLLLRGVGGGGGWIWFIEVGRRKDKLSLIGSSNDLLPEPMVVCNRLKNKEQISVKSQSNYMYNIENTICKLATISFRPQMYRDGDDRDKEMMNRLKRGGSEEEEEERGSGQGHMLVR